MQKRKLYSVDQDTGELLPSDQAHPGILHRDEEIAALKKEKAGWITRYYNLKREYEADEGHELFPVAQRLFFYWKERCNHPNSDFTAERFKAILPHLRDLGEEMCRNAIDGAAYDPYIPTERRRNGSVKRFDGWDLIFRSRDKMEDFANRAPYHLPSASKVKALADALMFVWPLEPDEAVDAAQRMLR